VQASSNQGIACVDANDIRRAANDALAVRTGDFAFVRKVALGEIQLQNESDHIKDLRARAIYRLTDFNSIAGVKVLKRIAAGTDKKYADIARHELEELKKKEQGGAN
jgi:hypothetical protein